MPLQTAIRDVYSWRVKETERMKVGCVQMPVSCCLVMAGFFSLRRMQREKRSARRWAALLPPAAAARLRQAIVAQLAKRIERLQPAKHLRHTTHMMCTWCFVPWPAGHCGGADQAGRQRGGGPRLLRHHPAQGGANVICFILLAVLLCYISLEVKSGKARASIAA